VPRITVLLPLQLSRAAGGMREVEVEAMTVGEALASLRGTHSALAHLILQDSDEPRRAVALFLNEENVLTLGRLETPVAAGDRLSVLLPVAGG